MTKASPRRVASRLNSKAKKTEPAPAAPEPVTGNAEAGQTPAAQMTLNDLIAEAEQQHRRGVVPVDWRAVTYTAVNMANNYVAMLEQELRNVRVANAGG